jgi:hypothetical protein
MCALVFYFMNRSRSKIKFNLNPKMIYEFVKGFENYKGFTIYNLSMGQNPAQFLKPAQPPCFASVEAAALLLVGARRRAVTPLQPRPSPGARAMLRHETTPGSSIFSPFLAASTKSNKTSSPTRILHGNLFKS